MSRCVMQNGNQGRRRRHVACVQLRWTESFFTPEAEVGSEEEKEQRRSPAAVLQVNMEQVSAEAQSTSLGGPALRTEELLSASSSNCSSPNVHCASHCQLFNNAFLLMMVMVMVSSRRRKAQFEDTLHTIRTSATHISSPRFTK